MAEKKYSLKLLSIVIPTYNRAKDLEETLRELSAFINQIENVIIVDQSKNNQTKNLIKKIKNKKIKYIFSKIPSITIARNLGVENTSKNTELICFLDDDVTPGKNYFQEILKVFNQQPEAKAVAGYFSPEKMGKFESFIRKIFLIRNLEKDRARILSAYGNTYPSNLSKVVNAEWLPGVNMVYKKEIFKKQKFDENLLGYTIAEDIDFSYRLFKNYPSSIFITPFAKIVHRASTVEREPTRRMAYVNQVDHFYFHFKNLNNNIFKNIKFGWSILGISLLRSLNFIIKPSKMNYLKLKYFIESLIYSLKNIRKIKSGRVREFSL
jgi:GT2 family glycosyltransferase